VGSALRKKIETGKAKKDGHRLAVDRGRREVKSKDQAGANQKKKGGASPVVEENKHRRAQLQ